MNLFSAGQHIPGFYTLKYCKGEIFYSSIKICSLMLRRKTIQVSNHGILRQQSIAFTKNRIKAGSCLGSSLSEVTILHKNDQSSNLEWQVSNSLGCFRYLACKGLLRSAINLHLVFMNFTAEVVRNMTLTYKRLRIHYANHSGFVIKCFQG